MSRPVLSKDFVLEGKRIRIMEATARVVSEQGIEGAKVIHLTKAAGVARKTFYESFDGKDDCLEQTLCWVGKSVRREACESVVRPGLAAVLDYASAHADRAIFYLLHGPAVSLDIYEAEQDAFADLLDLEPASAQMVVGGISWTLRRSLTERPTDDPRELLDCFAGLIRDASRASTPELAVAA